MSGSVRVCQVEYIRDGAFLPDPSVFPTSFNGSPASGATGVSGHATTVQQLLIAPPATGLISSIWVKEATDYYGRGGLNAGLTFDSTPAAWEVENHSWGGTNALFVDDIIKRFDVRLKRDNVLAFVAVPDAGVGYTSMFGAQVPNYLMSKSSLCVRVGSSNLGMDILPGCAPDILAPDYTSFACPRVAALGIAMVALCKARGYPYDAQKLKQLIIQGADRRSGDGAAILNTTFPMTLLQNLIDGTFIPSPPVVNPTPVVTPTPTPAPTPPAPSPVNQPTEDMYENTLVEAAGFSSDAPFLIQPKAFTHLPVPKVNDPGGNYNNGLYTVPADGTYELSHMVRLADNLPVISYGAGIYTADQDFNGFKWTDTQVIPPGASFARNANDRTRIRSFKAGDQLRLVVYNDSNSPIPAWSAEMTIRRVL